MERMDDQVLSMRSKIHKKLCTVLYIYIYMYILYKQMKVASRYYEIKHRSSRKGWGLSLNFCRGIIINSCAFNSREFLNMQNIEE